MWKNLTNIKLTKAFLLFLLLLAPMQVADAAYLKWDKKPLLVCLPPNQNSALMKEAFVSWQKAIKDRVTFNFLTANSCPNADITVSYSPNKRASLTSYSYRGDYFIKAHIDMGLLNTQGQSVSNTLLMGLMQHEIGHAIGLIGHTNTPNSVMQPTVKEGYKITQDSIDEIYKLYK